MTDLHQNLLIDLIDSENLPNVNKKVTFMRKIKTFIYWFLLYLRRKKTDQVPLKQIAIHEAGHVVAGYFTEHKVHFTTIVPIAEYGGITLFNHINKLEWFSNPFLQVVIGYGGKVAEELFLGQSLGDGGDQPRIDELVMKMVTKWGMAEKIGYMNFATASEEDKKLIIKEVNSVKAKAQEFAKQIITEHIDGFIKIVAVLMTHYSLGWTEIKEILDGNSSFFS